MEKFKEIEREMRTKAYPKEHLLGAIQLDPRERAKMKAREFLSTTVEKALGPNRISRG